MNKFLFAAGMAILPLSAGAATISVDIGGGAFTDSTTESVFATTVGGISLKMTSETATAGEYDARLSSTVISTDGVGEVTVTFEEDYDIDAGLSAFETHASVADNASNLIVTHYVKFNDEDGFIELSMFDFGSASDTGMSDLDMLDSDGTFTLRSVYRITHSENEKTANMNGDIFVSLAPIPVPAAGFLLLGGLAGLVGLRRRK